MSKLIGYAVAYVADNYDKVSVGVMFVSAATVHSIEDAKEHGIARAKSTWPDGFGFDATVCGVSMIEPEEQNNE